MMFSQCVISFFTFVCFQASDIGAEVVLSNCHPNIDIRFGDESNMLGLSSSSSSSSHKLPHAEALSYDNIANAFLSTASLALQLAGKECRQDICLLAKNRADVRNISEIAVAVTALTNLPYGLRLLLCSDGVTIRSVKVEEILYADKQHDNKVQTARTKSIENEAYKWRFEPVVDVFAADPLKYLQFRIRNAKTNHYLRAERKFSLVNGGLRRVVYTDPVISDIWELKMMSELNGNFNRFTILNVHLGEYLYASRGFCYDNVTDTNDCSTRPSFTWEYKTLKEVEEDDYNQFIMDEFELV